MIGTQLNAYRALGGGTATLLYDAAAGASAPAIVTNGSAGVFGGKVIQKADSSHTRGVIYPGGANIPSAPGPITWRIRIVPQFTGTPAAATMLMSAEGMGAFNNRTCWFYLDTSNKLEWLLADQYGKQFVNSTSGTIGTSCAATVPIEFMASWDGTTNAGAVTFSCNGVACGTSTANNAAGTWNNALCSYVYLGGSGRFPSGNNYDINEAVIYNTAQAVTYTPGSTFVTDTAFDASVYTDPGTGSVQSGTTYTFAGTSETGTLVGGKGHIGDSRGLG